MHGGRREGAGRKPAGTKAVMIRLTPEQQQTLRHIGGSTWIQNTLKEINMKAQDIIIEATDGTTTWGAIQALEDGEYLASIGCTDDDQPAVEEAYAILQKRLDDEIAAGKFDPATKEYTDAE